ncbi:MAG: F0F1 ATP synthase subunit gamma [Thauera sp.]|nr:F0F1 ATP synthase subunit gamma [Thauera sp.]
MSKRRELARRMASMTDIGELLGAMKNLALVESQRIAAFIEAQRLVASIVRDALADVLRHHGEDLLPPARDAGQHAPVLCVIGSERGFCGDLNQRLIDAARGAITTASSPPAVVLVGQRLIDAWDAGATKADACIVGAGFADEADAVLARLLAALAARLAPSARRGSPRVDLLHMAEGGVRSVRVLPADLPPGAAAPPSHSVALNLPAVTLYAELLGQYLETGIGTALYDALLYENQARLAYLEQARQRIDERLIALGRLANRARQEEITEEIEIILLSGQVEADNPAR